MSTFVLVHGAADSGWYWHLVEAELRARGHDVEVTGPWTLGRVSAVSRGSDGVLRAAANPRGMQGYAAGR